MKLMSTPGKGYPFAREPRQELVTREEWEDLFAPFSASVRHQMANLAAHNWHIIHDGERVGAIGPSNYYGHWLYSDGTRVNMTEEEQNAFFPIVDDSLRGFNAYVTVYPGRGADGNSRPAVIRQRQIVIPVISPDEE